VIDGTKKAIAALTKLAADQIPSEILRHLEDVTLTTATDGTQIYFPCPFKETEATVALKSVEASVVAAIAQLRYPNDSRRRKIEVDLERTATFLFSTYIATIAGLGKQDPNVKSKLKGGLKQRVLITELMLHQIPIYFTHNRFYIVDWLQISTKPRNLEDTTIFMDLWTLRRR
jgi:hypothetical protein